MDPSKDYYKALDIPESASQAEIKKAFHKLAKKYHPDLHPDDSSAEKKFKEINEAYDILSDTKKRTEYDQLRKYAATGRGFYPGGSGYNRSYSSGNLEDLFGNARGAGGVDIGDILGQFFNVGGRKKAQPRKGNDLRASIDIPFATAIRGGKEAIRIDGSGGKSKTINLKIPAGIEDGGKIRLRGLGQSIPGGGPAGDLIVTVHVKPHKSYYREGNNLFRDISVGLKQAVLGTKVRFETPLGEKVEVKIPPGTSPGTKLRVRGKGIASNGKRGDLFVVVNVKLPGKLTKAARQKFEEFIEEAGL